MKTSHELSKDRLLIYLIHSLDPLFIWTEDIIDSILIQWDASEVFPRSIMDSSPQEKIDYVLRTTNHYPEKVTRLSMIYQKVTANHQDELVHYLVVDLKIPNLPCIDLLRRLTPQYDTLWNQRERIWGERSTRAEREILEQSLQEPDEPVSRPTRSKRL